MWWMLWLWACGSPPEERDDSRRGPTTTPTGSEPADTATDVTSDEPSATEDSGSPTVLPAADTVWLGADLVTLDAGSTRATELAILDGELVHVGDDASPWIGPDTEVIDLEGRMVVPGLIDSHTHLLEAFHEAGSTCIIPSGPPLTSHRTRLEDCADSQVGTEWVLGWGWSIYDYYLWPTFDTPLEVIDAAIPDRPAAIMEETSHSVWVNSMALQALGFDSSSPDPVGGVLVKQGGELNGLLLDAAGEQAFDLAYERTSTLDAMNEAAIRAGVSAANAEGITSVADARAYWKRGHVDAWKAVEADGDLNIRAVLGLWAYPDEDDTAQLATLTSMYDDVAGARVRLSQIKLYSDGLLQNTTAALLDPYEFQPFGLQTGLNYFDAARLQRYVTELERVGFDMHIHAIGDRGVRESLNAIEAAQAENGPLGARHRLTHLEWVHPDDVGRFATLGVTADFQMSYRWVELEHLDENHLFVGEERTDERLWRLGDLHRSGARVVLSSDYDVGSLSPFVGMARSLDRSDQSLPDVQTALQAYTVNAAELLRQEDLTGTLEVGKRADLVVVDRDLFLTDDLAGTTVLLTLLDGDEVYRHPSFGGSTP